MTNDKDLTLDKLIDIKTLISTEKKLSNLLNFSIVTTDCLGNVLGETVNYTHFCQLICSSKKGKDLCQKSKSRVCEKLSKIRECTICNCYMGLKNCIYPIVVDDTFLGNIIIGQFFLEEEYNEKEFDVEKFSEEFSIPENELREALLKIPIVSKKHISKCLECCELLADYLKDMYMKGMAEKRLLHQMEQKLEFEDKLKKAQLKTLEAQINPHFLFNTLNSIARMSFFEDSPKTEEMIYCLSDLLRYSIKQTEEFPTIASELENIERYLFIQGIRYKDRLKYNIDIPKEILCYRIPSMTLQPIVENAIIHGLEPKADGGEVYILGEIKDDIIKLIVKDTGVGISHEKVNSIFNHSESHIGLGILNSHHRLNTYFGSNYGLKITGTENVGTVVEMSLPCFKEIALLQK